jgi:hypothetical protein
MDHDVGWAAEAVHVGNPVSKGVKVVVFWGWLRPG